MRNRGKRLCGHGCPVATPRVLEKEYLSLMHYHTYAAASWLRPQPPKRLSATHAFQSSATRREDRAIDAWGVVREIGLALVRRPLLALTLGIALVLLVSTITEAVSASAIESQVGAVRSHNATTQAQITDIERKIDHQKSSDTIMTEAQRLGFILPSPVPTATP